MALTATPTSPTRKEIMKRLDMKKAVVVYLPPAKLNIVYVVMDKTTIEDIVQPIVKELLAKGVETSKKIVYCRTYDQVAHLLPLVSDFWSQFYFTTWCSKSSKIPSSGYVYKV